MFLSVLRLFISLWTCRTGGMADTVDSKSTARKGVPVQVRGPVFWKTRFSMIFRFLWATVKSLSKLEAIRCSWRWSIGRTNRKATAVARHTWRWFSNWRNRLWGVGDVLTRRTWWRTCLMAWRLLMAWSLSTLKPWIQRKMSKQKNQMTKQTIRNEKPPTTKTQHKRKLDHAFWKELYLLVREMQILSCLNKPRTTSDATMVFDN